MELRESIARATATAGGAVVFAGFTVVIALCSLAFAGIPLVTTLGFTAAIAVVVAVCAAATLLPAMLGALGPRINSLRRPARQDPPRRHGSRTAGGAGRERVAGPAVALGDRGARVLVVLALPIFQLELGQNDISALPKDNDLAPGLRRPHQGLRARRQRAAADRLEVQHARRKRSRCCPACEKAIGGAADVAAVTEPTFDKQGTVAVFTVIANSAPWADETVDLVEDLRDKVIPRALEGTEAPPTSAARPPATSTSPPRSATSCR